jgi:hypothetical protein
VSVRLAFAASITGISFAPVCANRIAGAGEPFFVLSQLLKCPGREELRGIAGGMTERLQQAYRNQDRNVMRFETKKPRSLGGVEAGRGNLPTQKFGLLRYRVHTPNS